LANIDIGANGNNRGELRTGPGKRRRKEKLSRVRFDATGGKFWFVGPRKEKKKKKKKRVKTCKKKKIEQKSRGPGREHSQGLASERTSSCEKRGKGGGGGGGGGLGGKGSMPEGFRKAVGEKIARSTASATRAKKKNRSTGAGIVQLAVKGLGCGIETRKAKIEMGGLIMGNARKTATYGEDRNSRGGNSLGTVCVDVGK